MRIFFISFVLMLLAACSTEDMQSASDALRSMNDALNQINQMQAGLGNADGSDAQDPEPTSAPQGKNESREAYQRRREAEIKHHQEWEQRREMRRKEYERKKVELDKKKEQVKKACSKKDHEAKKC
jgi:hypothetical protein